MIREYIIKLLLNIVESVNRILHRSVYILQEEKISG